MNWNSINQKVRFLIPLLFLFSLFSFATAKENVLLNVDQTQLSVSAGETFSLTYLVRNPFESVLNGKTDSIEQFDLYLLDIDNAYLSIESIEPSSWKRETISAYGDEHLSRLSFNSDRVKITFRVNEKALTGTYFLKGYYSYFGDEATVGLSPAELGEAILPMNDSVSKNYAQITITPKKENPFSFIGNSSTNWVGILVIIGVIVLIAAVLFALQQRAQKR